MITDINHKSIRTELDKSKLPLYWKKYFEYETDLELCNLTKNELLNIINIEKEKKKATFLIDSQIVISEMLTMFHSKHIFHVQYNENHVEEDKEKVLGMQLYHLMLHDADIWVYTETKKRGHPFSHATYFKESNEK